MVIKTMHEDNRLLSGLIPLDTTKDIPPVASTDYEDNKYDKTDCYSQDDSKKDEIDGVKDTNLDDVETQIKEFQQMFLDDKEFLAEFAKFTIAKNYVVMESYNDLYKDEIAIVSFLESVDDTRDALLKVNDIIYKDNGEKNVSTLFYLCTISFIAGIPATIGKEVTKVAGKKIAAALVSIGGPKLAALTISAVFLAGLAIFIAKQLSKKKNKQKKINAIKHVIADLDVAIDAAERNKNTKDADELRAAKAKVIVELKKIERGISESVLAPNIDGVVFDPTV